MHNIAIMMHVCKHLYSDRTWRQGRGVWSTDGDNICAHYITVCASQWWWCRFDERERNKYSSQNYNHCTFFFYWWTDFKSTSQYINCTQWNIMHKHCNPSSYMVVMHYKSRAGFFPAVNRDFSVIILYRTMRILWWIMSVIAKIFQADSSIDRNEDRPFCILCFFLFFFFLLDKIRYYFQRIR